MYKIQKLFLIIILISLSTLEASQQPAFKCVDLRASAAAAPINTLQRKSANANANASVMPLSAPTNALADTKREYELGVVVSEVQGARDEKLIAEQQKVDQNLNEEFYRTFSIQGKEILLRNIIRAYIVPYFDVQRNIFPIALSENDRNGIELRGHTSRVHSAQYSPDGTQIVTASHDKTARIWDTKTGAEILTLKGHIFPLTSAQFNHDCTQIVTASRDETAKIWDAKTGRQLSRICDGAALNSAQFSPDGTQIVIASECKTPKVCDAKTGAELYNLKGHSQQVYSAQYNPDGTRIVTTSRDYTVRIWDAKTGTELKKLTGNGEIPFSARFSPDGTRIATGSNYEQANIWDAMTGRLLSRIKGHFSYMIRSVQFNHDGTQVVTTSNDKTVRVWNAQTGAAILIFNEHGDWRNSAEYSPDGTQIVVSSDSLAKVWNLAEIFNFYNTALTPDQLMFFWKVEQMLAEEKKKNPENIFSTITQLFKNDNKNIQIILPADLLVGLSTFPPTIQRAIVKKYNINNPPAGLMGTDPLTQDLQRTSAKMAVEKAGKPATK